MATEITRNERQCQAGVHTKHFQLYSGILQYFQIYHTFKHFAQFQNLSTQVSL